jgi:O-antigen/teichoic acid export membrane protein
MSEPTQGTSPKEGISRRALRSGAGLWMRQLITGGVSLVTAGILARHLTPAEFGVVALATVTLRILVMLSRGGVGDFVIVDRKEGREDRVQAAFWMSVAIAGVTAAIILAGLPLIRDFYDSPQLAHIMPVFVANFVLSEIAVVPEALVKRTLVYERLTRIDITSQVLASVTGAVLAVLGFGVWSLVLPILVMSPIRTVALFRLSGFRPSRNLGLREWPSIARFTFHIIGQNVGVTIGNESDTLLVGRVLGPHDVGIYANAWNAAGLLMDNTVGVVRSLALPSLSAAATDMERLRVAFRRMIRALSLLSIPAFTGMFVVAREFVLTLYGPKWLAAVLPLRIFIIFAVRRSIGSPAMAIYTVVGRVSLAFRLSLVFIPIFVASVWLGLHWGLVGVATTVTIARTTWGMVHFAVILRLLEERGWRLWQDIAPIVWASLSMGAIVALARYGILLVCQPPTAVLLLGMAGFGVVAFVVLARFVFPAVGKEVVAVVSELHARLGKLARRLLLPTPAK